MAGDVNVGIRVYGTFLSRRVGFGQVGKKELPG